MPTGSCVYGSWSRVRAPLDQSSAMRRRSVARSSSYAGSPAMPRGRYTPDSGTPVEHLGRLGPGGVAGGGGGHRDHRQRRLRGLGVDIGDCEDETFRTRFCRGLRARGLSGVRLAISDARAGLRACFAGASWQRCRVHFVRNQLANVPNAHAEFVAAAFRSIFALGTPTRSPAPSKTDSRRPPSSSPAPAPTSSPSPRSRRSTGARSRATARWND